MPTYHTNLHFFPVEFSRRNLTAVRLGTLRGGRKPDGIVVIGMGGSGLAGDLLVHFSRTLKLTVPTVVWKDYSLPQTTFRHPLFVLVSFSGTTEEVLSALRELLARRPRPMVGVVTTGGPLRALAERAKLPLVTFPTHGLTPREAVGYTYTGLTELLRAKVPMAPMPRLPVSRLPAKKLEKQGAAIAGQLTNSIPLIYTTTAYRAVGYIWKINLNETGKHPAFAAVMPEASHNEITGLEKCRFPLTALFIEDPAAPLRLAKKVTVLRKLLAREGVRTLSVPMTGKTFEERTWNAIVLSHFTALALAKLGKKDPRATRLIDAMKRTWGTRRA
jgi:glucose/mannose-6-phosphate isomerase